jgi:succinate-semialdehyde dehydrogenase/glutarate-semialdehyde dehydrogenase
MARMIVGGEPAQAKTQQTIEVRNPSTGEIVDTVPLGTRADVDAAVEAARQAFPAWSRLAPHQRAQHLGKAAQAIREDQKVIAELLTKEQGKTLKESQIETARLADNLDFFAGITDKLRGYHIPLNEPDKYGMVLRRPLGVCAAIVPWNFPLTLLANKMAPALAAGNTIVVKPSSTTPLSTLRAVQAMYKSALPAGVVNVVTGPGNSLGQALVTHPVIRKIGFTGQTATGQQIMEQASASLKRLTLELGGSDPMIVCDDADLDKAASAAAVGRFFNCGQACLAIKRLYLFDSIADAFMEKFLPRVHRLKVGDGMSPDVRMGPMHTEQQRREVENMVEDAVRRGAKVAAGGGRPKGPEFERGWFIQPTVLTDVPPDALIVKEECFGPALPVMRIKDLDEGIRLGNDSVYGLGSSIWTRDIGKARRASEELEAGYTWVNALQVAHDELPFGGVKMSGFGKEHGIEALEAYTELKSVIVGS